MPNFTPAIDQDELVGVYKKAICANLVFYLENMKRRAENKIHEAALDANIVTLNTLSQNPEMLTSIDVIETGETFVKLQYTLGFEIQNDAEAFVFGASNCDLVFNLTAMMEEGYAQEFVVNMLKDVIGSLKRICPMMEEEW